MTQTPQGPMTPPSGWTAWHPPQAVLELVELVLTGALPRLPRDVFGDRDPAGGLIIEDAERTPVAVATPDNGISALRPFSHPPLRGHRLTPAQVRDRLAAGDRLSAHDPSPGKRRVLAVPVAAPLTQAAVERLRALVGRGPGPGGADRVRLLWLVVVGAERGRPHRLSPEGLLRAVRLVASDLETDPVIAPVALPSGYDHLLDEVARAYGATDVAALDEGGGDLSPAEPLHPAFTAELARAAVPSHRRGLVVFFTGLSGSGKSTVAKALAERVLERGVRSVSLLDGDEVRRLLSAGLGFSAADRAANIARIGFVAAEVARHGGMAVAAPIAPFAAGRADVRRMVEEAGGRMVLVHVATPLSECERRDRKGLYARARRGEVPEFTGISSPYEEPTDADLVLDTTGREVADCVDRVWHLLQERGLLVEGPSIEHDGPAASADRG